MDRVIVDDVFVFIGMMATLGSLTKIILTVITRRRAPLKESTLDEMAQRLARMEQALDATAIEVERISEAHRFTTKLLVEKGHQAPPAESTRARVVTPH